MKHMPITPALLRAIVEGDPKNIAAAAVPGGIEAQEMAGQMDQAAKETLPVDLKPDRRAFERLGFEFGGVVEGIFLGAKFPPGWSKKPTGHSMWTDLVDGQGRKRGGIFYKAAFYDRSAYAHLVPRFILRREYKEGTRLEVYMADAMGKVQSKHVELDKPNWGGDRGVAEANQAAIEEAEKNLSTWMDVAYPDWRLPTAYWEEV